MAQEANSLDALAEEAQRLQDTHAAVSTSQAPSSTPTMGNLKKISYTHDAMIDLIIARPELSANQLAACFGYTPAWISNIRASDAFQARLAQRREEIIDPTLKATIEERIRGLVIRSMEVLQEKLDKPAVSDQVALRAFELGAKALGIGGHAAPKIVPVDLSNLAERLVALKSQFQGNPPIPGQFTKEITDGQNG